MAFFFAKANESQWKNARRSGKILFCCGSSEPLFDDRTVINVLCFLKIPYEKELVFYWENQHQRVEETI
jgi:hypothetical protein